MKSSALDKDVLVRCHLFFNGIIFINWMKILKITNTYNTHEGGWDPCYLCPGTHLNVLWNLHWMSSNLLNAESRSTFTVVLEKKLLKLVWLGCLTITSTVVWMPSNIIDKLPNKLFNPYSLLWGETYSSFGLIRSVLWNQTPSTTNTNAFHQMRGWLSFKMLKKPFKVYIIWDVRSMISRLIEPPTERSKPITERSNPITVKGATVATLLKRLSPPRHAMR